MSIQTESRQALRELIELLQEVDEHRAGPEWNIGSAGDVAGAQRALMHMLEGGLVGMFERDPTHPESLRIVTPSRKFTDDNADAINFDAPVSMDHVYTVRSDMDGAVCVSITLEMGTVDGSLGSQAAGMINETAFDVDAAGMHFLDVALIAHDPHACAFKQRLEARGKTSMQSIVAIMRKMPTAA